MRSAGNPRHRRLGSTFALVGAPRHGVKAAKGKLVESLWL
jgi:hypothetical protein